MNEHDIINEIRNKTDIVDLISSYIPLTLKGKNHFGVCPFHEDTNPSMSVSREKQIYRCFSCGASGNVFNFVMDYEHLSFRETLEFLAKKQNLEIKGLKITEKKEKYQEYYDIYDITNKYFQNNLNTQLGKKAKEYLQMRNLDDTTIKEFGIGLSLKQDNDLTNILLQKNYPINTLNNIGLSNQDHDIYIDRIMFPLHDLNGRVVGFSGRIYNTNLKENKYINTKGTPIFQKGNNLYNYHRARDAARLKKQIIVMEGFMGCIRASTVEIKNVVSLMGTAMTKEQAELIKRLSNNIVLCLDGDDAGSHATLVNGEQLSNMDVNVKVIELPENLDPDDYIIKYGKERFEVLLENAINYNDFKIKYLRKGINFKSDEELSRYLDNVIIEISKVKDDIRREIMLKNLANEFNIGYNTLEKRLQEKLNNIDRKEPIKYTKVTTEKRKDKYYIAILACLYYMIENPKMIKYYENEGIIFPTTVQRNLVSEIIFYFRKYGNINLADFYTYLSNKEELLSLLNEIVSLDLEENINDSVMMEYINVVKEYNIIQEIKRLQELIKKEINPLEQAKIAERIKLLKIGS
ncbi:MAG: DNA primase [Bacilli bacterium]|nr:DNA primase [Bacilli bacterium]